MKKKQVIVVKKIDKMSPKKEIYISRKAQNMNSVSADNNSEWKESFVGNPAPQRPTRDDNENILSRSILGDPKVFESFVDLEDVPPSPVTPVKRTLKNSETTSSISSNHVSNKKKSVFIQPPVKLDPKLHPGLYLESLQKLKMKAYKLREKEIEKETKLIQYLPVNERFDLNKEGKVLAMWQERQKKWDKIQKSLAKRVGGTTDSLMMNTGDEFRARNEEYDVLQAAIPVHERFGAESWKMMLRDGTERAVSIGHVFSGLSCPISIKTTVPATIRKPRQAGSLTTKTSNSFIDPTPSLLKRQKQLHKTLQTLRPHSLGPSEVEGFFINSKNLFDWAIQSSERYFQEKQNNMKNKTQTATVVTPISNIDEKISKFEEYTGPQITFLSSRNILFSNLQGETIHQTVIFKNTGPSALSYLWKSVPERELHEPSDVALVMSKRSQQPRAHQLSHERSPFFCCHSMGQILPGETVETVFSFCSKGSGGNFLETWILDTLPRAVVYYATTSASSSSSSSNTNSNGQGKGNQTENIQNSTRSQSSTTPLPSTVYIKLKGHAYTLDECHHRRAMVAHHLLQGSTLGNMSDETYFMIRRVRSPVSLQDLNQRKLQLFKEINEILLMECSPLFQHSNNIKLTNARMEEFIHLQKEISYFGSEISEIFLYNLDLLKESESHPVPGVSQTNFDQISVFSPPEVVHQGAIRDSLFPEKIIEIFDEVTEDMITSTWNYNLNEVKEFIQQLVEVTSQIQSFEEKTRKNLFLINKARVYAEKKAQDSDYEDEEEEEEEEPEGGEEGDEHKKPKSPLLQRVEFYQFRLNQMIFNLLIDPLPPYSQHIFTTLGSALDEMDTFKSTSLDSAGLKGDLIIPSIPSPFTTEEGNETWQSILSLRQPLVGKKPPPSKPQKGYASDEQRKKYYLSMYELVSNALLEGAIFGLTQIDQYLNQQYLNQQYETMDYTTLSQISSIRHEDFSASSSASASASASSPSPVFVSFNGDCFGPLPKSAFDVSLSLKLEAITPLIRLVEFGVDTLILLFESISNCDQSFFPEMALEITNLLTQQWTNVPKRHKRPVINFTTKYLPTLADLNFYLDNQKKISQSSKVISNNSFERNVTILLLENLLSSSLVPKTPDYVEEMSDDEEDPIPIGILEDKEAKQKAWASLEPRNLSVSIESFGKIVSVNCLTDGAAALNSLISRHQGIFVHGNLSSFFPYSNGVITKFQFQNTLVSDKVRESLNWLAVLTSFPQISSLRTATEPSSSTTSPRNLTELHSFGDYLSHLFPSSTCLQPSLAITIGGKITTQKIRFLEYAIDMANSIFLVGEFSLPFLLATGIRFVKSEIFSVFKLVASNLLAKARLRGVAIVLPVDLVVGDELISSEHLSKCYVTIDRDSRDEGGDYEGESTVVSCESSESAIPGSPFDIGPISCQNLRQLIPQHHLHLSWGTAGCCEISSFQAGQRALVDSSIRKSSSSSSSSPSSSSNYSLRNIIIGESNVEWWSRIRDPEGEFNGNLVKKGDADFICRESLTFTSIISYLPSTQISNILRRTPNGDEWDYLTAARKDENPEEEDEEEEEEEDD